MSEQVAVPDTSIDELEASATFEAFYQAEARTLFRRLWLVTGNRAEAEEPMQDAFLHPIQHAPRPGEAASCGRAPAGSRRPQRSELDGRRRSGIIPRSRLT